MEAAERQQQMDQATGMSEPERPRQSRQPRQSNTRNRPARMRAEAADLSEQEGPDQVATPGRERPEPRRSRQSSQNRQRRQRRPNPRNRQERRDAEPDGIGEANTQRRPRRDEQNVAAREERNIADEERFESAEEPTQTIENREELEKLTGEILGYLIAAMNVEVEAYVLDELRDGSIVFEVEGADSGLLIGRRGETLRDVQFIVRMLVNRQLKQRANIVIDVESYQQRRTQKLHTLAESAARAASRGRARSLDPMTAEERRIVHMALSDNPQVVTESEGQGAERHVVVKPR